MLSRVASICSSPAITRSASATSASSSAVVAVLICDPTEFAISTRQPPDVVQFLAVALAHVVVLLVRYGVGPRRSVLPSVGDVRRVPRTSVNGAPTRR